MGQFNLGFGGGGGSLVDDLNAPQRQAVLACDGPVLVLAGAGSGKTRTLTRKVAYLVQEGGYAPWEILAVTFTNKAAGEMRERCSELLGARAEDLWLGTFHSIGVRLLRRHCDLIGYPRHFVIYDQADQGTMISRCLKALEIDEKWLPAKQVQSSINSFKQRCMDPQHPDMDLTSPIARQTHRIYERYDAEMKRAGAFDFGDLIYRPWWIMKHHPEVAFEYKTRWRYVLVDEFQDTNRAQYELLKSVLNDDRRLCVVGDDDQSIYRWRGAEVENILGFDRAFTEVTVVRLEQNYRSSGNILEVTGALIRQNSTRHDKTLWTERGAGEKVRVFEAQGERDEASYVVKRVAALRHETKLSEFAIFYRTNAQSRAFEDALRAEAIPYRVVGGLRFYDRAEIKDVVAYLKLMVNPADSVALERVINRPARGIGKTTLQRIVDHANQMEISIWEAVCEQARAGTKGVQKKLLPFVELMVELTKVAQGRSALAAIEAVLEKTKYLQLLEQDRSVEAQTRADNVKELVAALAEYSARPRMPGEEPGVVRGLMGFLEEVSLLAEIDRAELGDEAVSMMTAHTAKGLEFDAVFVTGMEDDLMPHANSHGSESGIEEERRLTYVAMTRARHHLHLTWAATRRRYGQVKSKMASRFMDDMPQSVLVQEDGWRSRAGGFGGRSGAFNGGSAEAGGLSWSKNSGINNRAGALAWSGSGERKTPRSQGISSSSAPSADPVSAAFDQTNPWDLAAAQGGADHDDTPMPGRFVFHPKFGEGRILEVEGKGDKAKVKVHWADGATRRIQMKFLSLV